MEPLNEEISGFVEELKEAELTSLLSKPHK